MQKAHEWCESNYRHCPIRLNAQYYLESFYHSLHYQTVSKPYDDEGVLHIEMYRQEVYKGWFLLILMEKRDEVLCGRSRSDGGCLRIKSHRSWLQVNF